MNIKRRDAILGMASIAVAGTLPALGCAPQTQSGTFPRKSDFRIADGYTYINGAYTHPMPVAAAEAYQRSVERRSTLRPPPAAGSAPMRPDPKRAFATLINAKPSEISYIPNTSTGENLVVEALGITRFDGNVVTDALHFEGALLHLTELKQQGLDLRIVMPREGRIHLEDLERVIDDKSRLVEISLVSMYNGFQHDLKAVCEMAHAHGAYVYADIIQGVGAVPFDVRTTDVDFAATATYKWLMGDFGLGFLYVREDLLDRVVKRTHWSYESAPDITFHMSPTDPRSPKVVEYTPGTDASTHFQLGTMASSIAAALDVSIPYINSLGVENIQRHRQPMIDRLQQEMPSLGFAPQTPEGSTSPIVTFAHKDAEGINRKLQAANVNVRVADYWIRISPSVYNDMSDIDRLLDVLS